MLLQEADDVNGHQVETEEGQYVKRTNGGSIFLLIPSHVGYGGQIRVGGAKLH